MPQPDKSESLRDAMEAAYLNAVQIESSDPWAEVADAVCDALLSDEAVKHAADALRDLLGNDTGFWPDSYEEVRTVLKAAVEKTGGQDV